MLAANAEEDLNTCSPKQNYVSIRLRTSPDLWSLKQPHLQASHCPGKITLRTGVIFYFNMVLF